MPADAMEDVDEGNEDRSDDDEDDELMLELLE